MINTIQIGLPLDLSATLSKCTNCVKTKDAVLTFSTPDFYPRLEILMHQKIPFVSFNDNSTASFLCKTKSLVFGQNISKNISQLTYKPKNSKATDKLSISQFDKIINKKVIELNHVGINFSKEDISEFHYFKFKNFLAKSSYLVNYPTGEEWPFIFPCSNKEFENGIIDQDLYRKPQFEIVFNDFHKTPLIQFDIKTTVNGQEEAAKLFPTPYGVSYENLKDIFRSVFIDSGDSDLEIRFDVNFSRNPRGSFNKWMLTKGGRVGIK